MQVETRVQRLDSEAAIAETIAGYDIVIDACDWPAHDIERWINSACFAARIPFIAMSHFPPVARVGPLYVPGVTGCFACQEIGYRRTYPLFDVAIEQQRGKGSPAATLGPACSLIGGQIGLDVMHQLTGLAQPSTLGVGHIYDLRTMEVEREPVVPEPKLPGLRGHAALLRQRAAGDGAPRSIEALRALPADEVPSTLPHHRLRRRRNPPAPTMGPTRRRSSVGRALHS